MMTQLSIPLPPMPPVSGRVSPGEVLRGFIRRSAKTQRQVAEEIGIDPTYLSQMVNDKLIWYNSVYFAALVRALGIRPEEVAEINPAAVIEFVTAPPSNHEGSELRKLADGELVEVPVYGMAYASPDGNCSTRPTEATALIPARYMRPNRCAYIVDGNSMDGGDKPIRHGDVVICDHSEMDLQDGRVYIVKVMGNGILLKRVRVFDGVPELQSDNRAHRTLRPDEAQILGLVVAVVPQVFVP